MNVPIRRLSTLVAALFVALLVSTTYIQFVQATELHDRPGNRRTLLADYSRERGSILVGGSAIAKSTPTKDDLKYLRSYPRARLYSQVTGYYSFVYGAGGGLEGASDAFLSGSSDKLFYRRMVDLLTGRPPSGASLELTLDPKAQQAADQALGDQRGAVVALDPRTGAVLAMVSHPQYDPNRLSSHNLKSVQQAWADLTADERQPLVNRAVAGNLYPPGSVFKIVTAAAALESGTYTKDSELPGPAVLDLPQTSVGLPNSGRSACGANGRTTLLHALEVSCNTAFGWLGLQLGGDALRTQAAKFGFGTTLQLPLRVTASSFPDNPNPPQTAQSAIGQFDVRVTPMQVAMVSAAVANGGVVMRPYLVKDVRSAALDVIEQTAPEQLGTAVTPQTAATLTEMMTAVVQSGTGTRAQVAGVQVAGKTGTAQHGEGTNPHAWFTAFAPAQDPKVAVAVVVEDGGNAGSEAAGGKVAAPIARAVMEAVLGR
ncbi:MAG TPA: penicillin-binding protein 2 [Dermatophilaceae bacterium]|nr:penicillin-binding protein 2 [Dermatophilaceae bacterium]